MKKIIFSLVVAMGMYNANAQEVFFEDIENKVLETVAKPISVNWESSFENAVKKAKKEHKPILLYFTGSDWCGPCKRIDKELFHTQKFADFSKDNLVLYVADFPSNRDLVSEENRKINKQLSKRYQQESFPTMIVVDEKGNVLGRKNGSYMVEYYYPFFEKITQNYK